MAEPNLKFRILDFQASSFSNILQYQNSIYFLSEEDLAFSSFSSFLNGIKETQKEEQIVWGYIASIEQSQG